MAKRVLSDGTQSMTSLRDHNGEMLYGTDDILGRIREFYSELYSGGSPVKHKRTPEFGHDILSVTESEVDYALNKLKNNKAAG